jgi:hypothetical protein
MAFWGTSRADDIRTTSLPAATGSFVVSKAKRKAAWSSVQTIKVSLAEACKKFDETHNGDWYRGLAKEALKDAGGDDLLVSLDEIKAAYDQCKDGNGKVALNLMKGEVSRLAYQAAAKPGIEQAQAQVDLRSPLATEAQAERKAQVIAAYADIEALRRLQKTLAESPHEQAIHAICQAFAGERALFDITTAMTLESSGILTMIAGRIAALEDMAGSATHKINFDNLERDKRARLRDRLGDLASEGWLFDTAPFDGAEHVPALQVLRHVREVGDVYAYNPKYPKTSERVCLSDAEGLRAYLEKHAGP